MWVDVLAVMKQLSSYQDLISFCANLTLPSLPSHFAGRIIEGIDFLDRIGTARSWQCDIPANHIPIQIVKDGNCLFRTLSKIIFNKESEHGQIRVRVVADAVKNEDSYLNDDCLKIGATEQIHFVQIYCTYSEYFNDVDMRPVDRTIREIYRAEWYENWKLSCYSGIFQMHAAANALKIKLVSHYPDHVMECVYKNMNQAFFPLGCNGTADLKTCHILWSSTSKDAHLNHIVPLLRQINQCKKWFIELLRYHHKVRTMKMS